MFLLAFAMHLERVQFWLQLDRLSVRAQAHAATHYSAGSIQHIM
jgi:hypothetical protein